MRKRRFILSWPLEKAEILTAQVEKFIPEVQITVVTLEGVDIDKCKKIAEVLGVGFRIRELDVVG